MQFKEVNHDAIHLRDLLSIFGEMGQQKFNFKNLCGLFICCACYVTSNENCPQLSHNHKTEQWT